MAPLLTWEIKHGFRKLLLIRLIRAPQQAGSSNRLSRRRHSLTSCYRWWKALGYLPKSLSMSPLPPSLERPAGSSSKLPHIIQQIPSWMWRLSIHNSWKLPNERHVSPLIFLGRWVIPLIELILEDYIRLLAARRTCLPALPNQCRQH